MSVGIADSVVRYINARAAKVDASDRRLTGYAIVFNARSQDLGGWQEIIAPSAVDRTLRAGTNVDALVDHRMETDAVLGSTDSGLLQLKKDRHGLAVDITPPDTQRARDLMTVVRAGLVKGMSFRFSVRRDPATGEQLGVEWDFDAEMPVRTVTDMEFSEVSIVLNPAYLDTDIQARNLSIDRKSLEEFRAAAWKPSLALRERHIRAGMR